MVIINEHKLTRGDNLLYWKTHFHHGAQPYLPQETWDPWSNIGECGRTTLGFCWKEVYKMATARQDDEGWWTYTSQHNEAIVVPCFWRSLWFRKNKHLKFKKIKKGSKFAHPRELSASQPSWAPVSTPCVICSHHISYSNIYIYIIIDLLYIIYIYYWFIIYIYTLCICMWIVNVLLFIYM